MTSLSVTPGAASCDLTSGFDSTYDAYLLVADGFSSSDSTAIITSRFYIGGSWITAGYQYSTTELLAGSTTSLLTNSSDINIKIASDILGGVTAAGFNAAFYIYNPSSTTQWKQVSWQGSVISYAGGNNILTSTTGSGTLQNSGAMTGFRLGLTSGTWQTGVIRLYGISNS